MQVETLAGKTAVVTGSSGDIGRAIALAMARAGADVVLHGHRRLDRAESLADEIRRAGRRAHVLAANFELDTACREFVSAAWQCGGRVDIWVNNAGRDVLTAAAAEDTFEQKLEQLWRVDVAATVQLSRRIGALMKKAGGGVILNMGWDQAWQGMAGDSGELFAATKGAVMAFSKSLAQSLAPEVRVNCLAPGWIQTAWGRQASEYWQRRARAESLRGRWGTPEDVAAAACFLAAPAADFCNGQILPINGGFRSHTD